MGIYYTTWVDRNGARANRKAALGPSPGRKAGPCLRVVLGFVAGVGIMEVMPSVLSERKGRELSRKSGQKCSKQAQNRENGPEIPKPRTSSVRRSRFFRAYCDFFGKNHPLLPFSAPQALVLSPRSFQRKRRPPPPRLWGSSKAAPMPIHSEPGSGRTRISSHRDSLRLTEFSILRRAMRPQDASGPSFFRPFSYISCFSLLQSSSCELLHTLRLLR